MDDANPPSERFQALAAKLRANAAVGLAEGALALAAEFAHVVPAKGFAELDRLGDEPKAPSATFAFSRRRAWLRRFRPSPGPAVVWWGFAGANQMLGREVRDPLGLEGQPGAEPGLGLLPVVTTMAGVKTTTQVTGETLGTPGAGLTISGYEIHLGVTDIKGPGRPALAITSRNGQPVEFIDGWVNPEGRVWGAYVHGLFESDTFRRAFLQELRQARGLSATGGPELSWQAFQEEQLDRLAAEVRCHLDLAKIRALVGVN